MEAAPSRQNAQTGEPAHEHPAPVFDAADSATSLDSPQSTEQDEIDLLLSEAAALSEEIVSGALAVEPPADEQTLAADVLWPKAFEQPLDVEPTDPAVAITEPDSRKESLLAAESITVGQPAPLQAVADVQSKVDELNDLLHDPDANNVSEGEARLPASQAESVPSVRLKQPEPPVEPASTSATVEAPKQALNAEDSSPPVSENGTSAADEIAIPKQRKKRLSPIRAVRAGVGACFRAVRGAIILMLNAGFHLITVLDVPLHRLTPRVKDMIGLAGIVTIIMGIAMWFLPGLIQVNPFAHLDAGVAQKAPSAPGTAAGH